jgi:hypothetical protein
VSRRGSPLRELLNADQRVEAILAQMHELALQAAAPKAPKTANKATGR